MIGNPIHITYIRTYIDDALMHSTGKVGDAIYMSSLQLLLNFHSEKCSTKELDIHIDNITIPHERQHTEQ